MDQQNDPNERRQQITRKFLAKENQSKFAIEKLQKKL